MYNKYKKLQLTFLYQKNLLFEQSHSVDLCTKNRVLFFEENWNLTVKAIP